MPYSRFVASIIILKCIRILKLGSALLIHLAIPFICQVRRLVLLGLHRDHMMKILLGNAIKASLYMYREIYKLRMDPIVYSDMATSASDPPLTSKLKDERNNIQIPYWKQLIEALASVKDSKRCIRSGWQYNASIQDGSDVS